MLWNIKIKPKQNMSEAERKQYQKYLKANDILPWVKHTKEANPFDLYPELSKKLKGKHDIVNEFIVDASVGHLYVIFSLNKSKKDSEYDIWPCVESVTITKIDEKKEINKLREKIDVLNDELSNICTDNLKDIQSRERVVKEGVLN